MNQLLMCFSFEVPVMLPVAPVSSCGESKDTNDEVRRRMGLHSLVPLQKTFNVGEGSRSVGKGRESVQARPSALLTMPSALSYS